MEYILNGRYVALYCVCVLEVKKGLGMAFVMQLSIERWLYALLSDIGYPPIDSTTDTFPDSVLGYQKPSLENHPMITIVPLI